MKNTIVLLAMAVLSSPSLAQDSAAMQATNGLASQAYMGIGKGVIVSVLDSGVDVTHPALRNSVYLQKDFTGEKKLDDDKGDVGHGTGIAGILLGNDPKTYSGLAPGARLINARVDTSKDVTSDLWAGNGLIWSARSGAKVANISFGNKLGQGPLTDKINLISDYVAERYGVNVVVAGGNENDTAVRQAPGALYNGYTVGALGGVGYKRTTDFSNYSLDTDARTKPDLVAPGEKVGIATADWEKNTNYWTETGTSFAAPMVGGVLAQMIGYGKAKGLSTDPLLLKAILLTSAIKAHDADGSPWSARSGGRDSDYGYLFTQPLDDEQGAGALDAVGAYRLYGKVKAKSTPLSNWREGKLKENQTLDLKLGKLYEGQHLGATLTWFRHVAYKDKNGNGPDGKDTFYQSATLADFTLELLRDGVPIGGSDSSVDNLEHLSWTLEATANYTLRVYRFEGSGLPSEAFALAAQVMKGNVAASVQRELAASRGEAYAASGLSRGFDVPEPTGVLWVVIGVAMIRRRRRR
ncbi:MAG: aprN [Phycisphaerales bacterium]|nr:aprN [Phycisphaerales bacterium]